MKRSGARIYAGDSREKAAMRSRCAWAEGGCRVLDARQRLPARCARITANGCRRHGARLRGDDRRCGAICGKTCRCVHRGEIIGRLNMRGGSRTERCAGTIGARRGSDPLRTASGDAAAVENRQALGDAAAFRHSLSERCVLSRSIARGDNANISAGAGGLTGGTARESAAPDRHSGPSGAESAARQAEQSAI